MKRILFALVLAIAPLSVAHASDAGLGIAASSSSVQVQGDFDLDRQFGVQAGIGEMLFLDDLSLTAGGRYYFVPKKVSPYVGGVFRTFEHRHHRHFGYDDHTYRETLVGPTLGLRARKWDGIGAFAQIELLTHAGDDRDGHHHEHHDDDAHWHTGLALGVQWWF